MQVVAAAASIRQTAELAGRRSCETCPDDHPHRGFTKLAGEHHTPDEQRPSILISALNPRGLKLGPFVDVLCGTV